LYAFAAFEAREAQKDQRATPAPLAGIKAVSNRGKTLRVARPLIPQVTVRKTLFLNHRQTIKNKPDGMGNVY
jgi:hypothetical protein